MPRLPEEVILALLKYSSNTHAAADAKSSQTLFSLGTFEHFVQQSH